MIRPREGVSSFHNWPYQKMQWGGESPERVRLERLGEWTHHTHQETFELNCSRISLALDCTLVAVLEMSLSTCLACAEVYRRHSEKRHSLQLQHREPMYLP